MCDHLCFGTSPHTHTCKCAIGYHMDTNDRNKCIGGDEFILYSIGYELKGIPMNSDVKTSIDDDEKVLAPISRVSVATNIDYHYKYDLLFWADGDRGTITSVRRDGTNRHVIVDQSDQFENTAGDSLSGIAVDWIADNIYWSDEKRNIIEVAHLNGSSRYVVMSNVEKPKSIALDPGAGLLFYAGDRKIGRTALDGSQHFILGNLSSQVTSLVLDVASIHVYFCESGSDTIQRADYDGNNKITLLNHSLENPVALALLGQTLYWADNSHQKGSIKMAPVQNLSDYRVLTTNEGNSLIDLKIFSRNVQNGTNPCAIDNGGCEELCLFDGTGPVCACSHGRLADNGKNCNEYEEFLIYSRVTSIESIHMTNHLNMNGPIKKIQNSTLLKNTIGLSYDYQRNRIFYSDIHSSSINWVFFNGSNHAIIVNMQLSVEGLAYDSISDQLFWTSNSDASIRTIDLKTVTSDYENNTQKVRPVIQLHTNDKPRGEQSGRRHLPERHSNSNIFRFLFCFTGIAVESCLGMVYWTNWNSQAAAIQRAYITGYGLEDIITTDIRMPNAVTLDYESHKLYWADARLDKIERANYDGTHRVVLAHSTPKHPFGMAVYGDLLFWTDWVLRAVLRANKYSGADVVWLRKDIGRLMGIVAVQNTTQNCSASPCSVLNGGCEDVCNVVAERIKCECTQGRLAPNGRQCIPLGSCPLDHFTCKTKDCIPFHLTCDSIKHCIDGSDEDVNYCNVRPCPNGFFRCQNHRCVPVNQTCDGIEHCGDRSDESICDCTPEQFKCKTGQCISNSSRCDGDPDCPDLSDETGCPQTDCGGRDEMLHCQNTTACYMPSWVCDEENDCWDNSDEMNCPNKTCSPEQFTCHNGQCINLSWRCDGEEDCNDFTDEADCPKSPHSCPPNFFRCLDNRSCIPESWQCDGSADCADGSDEAEHCKQRGCTETMFHCNQSSRCIEMKYRCDGDKDCPMNEDETGCDFYNPNSCDETEFQCLSGQCIDRHYYCDSHADCPDGTDEHENCEPSRFQHLECNANQFTCENRECVAKEAVCNGSTECVDGSDENTTLCANSTLLCAPPMFYKCGMYLANRLLFKEGDP